MCEMSCFVHCLRGKASLCQDVLLCMLHGHQDLSGMRQSLSGVEMCGESREEAKLDVFALSSRLIIAYVAHQSNP